MGENLRRSLRESLANKKDNSIQKLFGTTPDLAEVVFVARDVGKVRPKTSFLSLFFFLSLSLSLVELRLIVISRMRRNWSQLVTWSNYQHMLQLCGRDVKLFGNWPHLVWIWKFWFRPTRRTHRNEWLGTSTLRISHSLWWDHLYIICILILFNARANTGPNWFKWPINSDLLGLVRKVVVGLNSENSLRSPILLHSETNWIRHGSHHSSAPVNLEERHGQVTELEELRWCLASCGVR